MEKKDKERMDELVRIAKKYNVPLHMADDYLTKDKNIEAGVDLCERCEGTGNELYSAYRKCEDCNGTGVAK